MNKVGVFLFNGFQEMEFWYPMLRLREVGADVSAIGVAGTAAAVSVLDYPVVPNVAMADTSPGDYAALVLPGGNVVALADNADFKIFLRKAADQGVRIAAIAQSESFAHGMEALRARTTDDVPQLMRILLAELKL